jgi:predicted DsbA family dithiol-disulfide isomerase
VQWVYFPLHPDTPAEGLLLRDLFAGRGLDLDAMHARMKGLMDAEGLPYNQRTHTYNSRLAQELAKWADSQPGFEGIHDALYKGYFVEARNIGDPNVLVDIAKSVGLSPDDAQEVLTKRTFKNAVDADWEKARRYGITGVPSFVAGPYKIVGAQPYEVLAERLRAAGAPPRKMGS